MQMHPGASQTCPRVMIRDAVESGLSDGRERYFEEEQIVPG